MESTGLSIEKNSPEPITIALRRFRKIFNDRSLYNEVLDEIDRALDTIVHRERAEIDSPVLAKLRSWLSPYSECLGWSASTSQERQLSQSRASTIV